MTANMKWFETVKQLDKDGIKRMLNEGVDVNSLDIFDDNALHYLSYANDDKQKEAFQIASFLIDEGIDINKKNLLSLTAFSNPSMISSFPDVCHLLLDKGVDVFVLDGHGRNPLLWTFAFGLTCLSDRLINLGMDINEVDGSGLTIAEQAPFHWRSSELSIYASLKKYEHLLNDVQKGIVEKQKLRLLFRGNEEWS